MSIKTLSWSQDSVRPVLPKAITAVLGLLSLAVGLNFDFLTLFTELNPHIHMGGDNVIFWGPLSFWTALRHFPHVDHGAGDVADRDEDQAPQAVEARIAGGPSPSGSGLIG